MVGDVIRAILSIIIVVIFIIITLVKPSKDLHRTEVLLL